MLSEGAWSRAGPKAIGGGRLTSGGCSSTAPSFYVPGKHWPLFLTKLNFSSALKCGLISDLQIIKGDPQLQ